LPSCPALSLSSPTIVVPSAGSVFSILTVNGSSVPAGVYMITMTGTSGNLVHFVMVNFTFTGSILASQTTSLTVDPGSNGASIVGTGGLTFGMIGLVLPLLVLIGTDGSRNTRAKNIVHDAFIGHPNRLDTHRIVLVPRVGYVQIWKPSRFS
jgi:hypothetical protein